MELPLALIANTSGGIGNLLRREVSHAQELTICTAFLKNSGLVLLKDSMRRLLSRGGKVSVFAGLDFYLTEPDALWELFRLFRGRANASLYILSGSTSTFHPKVYCVARAGRITMVTGSANLTSGGLQRNIEAAFVFRGKESSVPYSQFREFIRSLKQNPRCSPADEVSIGQYHSRYSAYHKVLKEANKRAEKAADAVYDFNPTKMLRYLKEYNSDADEQDELRAKRSRYRKAQGVLNGMLRRRLRSKADFLSEYGKLVGAAEADEKLWHSGSVYRSKNAVAGRYRRFLRLLRTLKQRIGEPPEVLYELGMSHAADIPGLGPNVLTEILNTWAPKRYAVLNRNPVESLAQMGVGDFPSPQTFTPEKYDQFVSLLKRFAKRCHLRDLSHADHFCNYVYWKYVKPKQQK